MKTTSQLHKESLQKSNNFEASILFVDLDDTILDGTISCMTDEELEEAKLIQSTIDLISNAVSFGIPIVLNTRNTFETIDRLMDIRYDIYNLFNDVIASVSANKSIGTNQILKKYNIKEENALFIDDRESERDDVENNSNVVSLDPNQTKNTKLIKTI